MRAGQWVMVALLGAGLTDCKCKNSSEPVPQAPKVEPGLGAMDEKAPFANGAGRRRMSVDPAWLACTGEGQCVHAPSDCCGCSGGGTDVAINVKALESLAGARAQGCTESVCAMVMSTDATCQATARCVEGQCRLQTTDGKPVVSATTSPDRKVDARTPVPVDLLPPPKRDRGTPQ